MEKPKRKPKEDVTVWLSLTSIFEPLRFDYDLPASAAECADRLVAMDDYRRVLWIIPTWKTRVQINPIGDQSYEFTVRRRMGKNSNIEARGYIKGGAGLPTTVIGETQVPYIALSALLFVFFGGVMMISFMAVRGPASWLVLVFWGLIALGNSYYLVSKRDELTRQLEESLYYVPKRDLWD